MPTENIDALLTGTTNLTAQEEQHAEKFTDTHEEAATIESSEDVERGTFESQEETETTPDNEADESAASSESEALDDYGNPKQAPRTYTQEELDAEVNRKIRERLSRGRHNDAPQQQPMSQTQPQYADNITPEDWQRELDARIDQRVATRAQEEAYQKQAYAEQMRANEFREKFDRDMARFPNFIDVVPVQNLTPDMINATRGMESPAAFLYAAKRQAPQELERIRQISDPYVQVAEMGKLEATLRKRQGQTQAPKPVSRGKEDAGQKVSPKFKEPSIDDLIAQDSAKRMAAIQQRRR